ncbi:RagB/SusD family nutrient uptake outer membrane protein [Pedobacter gandavensis]|uniref:RagB/SusD family nutrient uptake outer membrane protein n=1 Tax=Pedobacter gandavensis TaxID=2679963 RepID=A0ABR6F272_9SPHI|nr:RagB/SusD family nutrient uptake outer membrane protein [Pedobacter gandavensis]MBB2150778.1 RagB/SusD family nutrient uptake outer membrane protein [Pedobacter gandavensis]
MKKIFIALLLTTGLCTGCKDYLDIKPKGYTIPESFEDYKKLLNDQSLYRVSSGYPNYLTDDAQAGELKDVNSSADYTLYSLFKRNLYSFQPGAVFQPGEGDFFYEPAYSHIFTYNVVINNIEKTPEGAVAEKKQLKAEALVGRAMEYFNLVNGYAVHYDAATASTDLGVPLILTEDINKKYTRNSVAEVYSMILKDLTEAQPNLSSKADHKFRPTKAAAYAFLSKVYLYMGRYTEALQNANEALKLNKNLIDYSKYTTQKGTWGRVCEIKDVMVPFPQVDKSIETVWARQTASSSGTVMTELYASADLLNVYAKDLPATAVDQRFNLFFCTGQAQFGTSIIKFPGRSIWAPYIEFNMAFSTGELMLIAAECEARIGDQGIALQHLNTLRNARIVGNKPLTATTREEVLRMSLEERRREMPFLGINRLVDLKRLNKDPRFAKTITHTFGTQTFTLPANDKRYVLPIPPKVLERNPSIPVLDR